MKIDVEGNEVVIRIPIPDDYSTYPLSASGYTRVLATTHGFLRLEGTDLKIAINLVVPRDRKERQASPEVQPRRPEAPPLESPKLVRRADILKLKDKFGP